MSSQDKQPAAASSPTRATLSAEVPDRSDVHSNADERNPVTAPNVSGCVSMKDVYE